MVAKKKKAVVKKSKPKAEVKTPIVKEIAEVEVKSKAKDKPKKTLSEIRAVLSLLNSMVRNNEQHNESSIKMFKQAIGQIDSLM